MGSEPLRILLTKGEAVRFNYQSDTLDMKIDDLLDCLGNQAEHVAVNEVTFFKKVILELSSEGTLTKHALLRILKESKIHIGTDVKQCLDKKPRL